MTGTSKTSGVLTCRAQNSFNNTVSTAESLALLATGDSRVIMAEITASKNEVGKGETIELNCELTKSYDLPAPTFKWYGRNGEMNDQFDSKLTVEFTMLDEASNSTEFSCKAEDQEASIESNKAKIVIKRKLKKIEVNIEILSLFQLKIIIYLFLYICYKFDIFANTLPTSKNNLTIRSNKTLPLHLECRAKDLDNTTIETVEWKKMTGSERSESVVVSSSSSLSFESLEVRDSGKYYCVVDEKYESETIEVHVDEYEPISLQIFVREPDSEASGGDSDGIVLLCTNLKGKPEPKIEWLHDDGTSLEQDSDISLSKNQFGLELKLGASYNKGILKCVAKNEVETKIVFINTRKCKFE